MFTNSEMTQDTVMPENDSEVKIAGKIEHAPAGACLPHYCPADADWVAAFHEDFVLAPENDNSRS
jgi:hypothetical protein